VPRSPSVTTDATSVVLPAPLSRRWARKSKATDTQTDPGEFGYSC